MISHFRTVLCLVLLLVTSPWAHAALTIEITEGVEGALPIAIVPFGWQGPSAEPLQDVAGIIAADLARSGRFAPVSRADLPALPHDGSEVDFRRWRALGAENLVVGRIKLMGPGSYAVQFQLFDVYKGSQLTGYSIPTGADELRAAAHHVADIIYEQLTGEPGAFNTRIAYVTADSQEGPSRYTLQVADSDGYGPQAILRSPQPIMSPSWSPDGAQLAYVSFENNRSEVYVQNVANGTRERVSAFPGINGAPAWSPDGNRLALTLSRDGNPDIYVLKLNDRTLSRLTDNGAIDTEATWSPDGKSLVFTSDRGGQPQLYRVAATGGRAQRLTFEGEYNAGASFSPDGKRLALVHGQGGRYRVAVLELESGLLRVVSDGSLDEGPSFAPNGSMILYASQYRGKGVLAAVSVDGRVRQRLVLQEGDVREPAWSPLR